MRFEPKDPPRLFEVDQPTAVPEPLYLKDCGNLSLATDEQITFVTESGGEYDVARKSWGYYATPSLNSRLVGFGLRAALLKDEAGKFVIVLVEQGREPEFDRYVEVEGYTVVCWMDSTASLEALEASVS